MVRQVAGEDPLAQGRVGAVHDGDDVEVVPQDPSTRTGSRLMPLKKFDRRRSCGPAGSIDRTRGSSSSKAMRDLEPREVRAHAEVHAARAEGQVRVRRAGDVEAVAVGEVRPRRGCPT